MKVTFKPGTKNLTKGGKKVGIVYCYYNQDHYCKGRNYTPVKMMKQHVHIISMQKITLEIWNLLPKRFLHDIQEYTKKFQKINSKLRGKYISSYSVFLKITHYLNKKYSISQMKTFDYWEYYELFGHLSIYDFIKLGVLEWVKDAPQINNRVKLLNKISFEQKDILDFKSIDIPPYERNTIILII